MTGPKTFIIAEAGVNHNGKLDLAFQLVDAAAAAGADAVKFQTWKTENVITKDAASPAYQLESSGTKSQFEMLKGLELPYESFRELKTHCDRKGIMFLSTADEIESAAFLNSIQPFFKIGSAELTDLPFLSKVAAFGKPIILSTGMGSLAEVRTALDVLLKAGAKKDEISILHCHSEYPTEYSDVNLRAMLTIKDAFGVKVGYSDHTPGIAVSVAAVALGAVVIEKHFTLDKRMPGPDHKASLEPGELKSLVEAIRQIESALGDGVKQPSAAEKRNMPLIRKSIVARKAIRRGEVFTEDNLAVKRPAKGIAPSLWDQVIGSLAKKDFAPDEKIDL